MERFSITADLSFSQLVYGMWRVAADTDTSPSHVATKINACLDQGITTFDQADIYGGYTAESVLGGALKANPALRAKMEIVTKCGIVAPTGRYADKRQKYYDTSKAHLVYSVECSLREMGIDHIDMLLIHRPDPLMDHLEAGAALDELVTSGKVRAVGVSNFKPYDWELLQSGMKTNLATNQIEISLAAPSAFTNGDIAFHQMQGDMMMAWSPLGGGGLMTASGQLADQLDDIAAEFGVDRAAAAVAFLLHHPSKILPVLGTNNLDRITKISQALKVKLTRETWFELYQAALGQEVP